jgi:hypothetical protein
VATEYTIKTQADEVLSYFYFVAFTVCLVAALFVLTQATIVVMFGPTMALKGTCVTIDFYSVFGLTSAKHICPIKRSWGN